MNNTYKDIEEHFSKFKLILDQHNETERAKKDLANIVDKLTAEVEVLKKSERELTQQLQTLCCASETQNSISTLYVQLKQKYKQLLKDTDVLQEKHLSESTELEERFASEKRKIIEDFVKQINEQKNEFLRKESELHNELQLVQASNALQYDEIETRSHTLQLQLRESNQSCNSLREEYLTFKMRSNQDMDIANKRIEELEQKLQLTEQQLFNATKYNNFGTHSDKPNQPQTGLTSVRSSKIQNKAPTGYIKNRAVVYDYGQYPTATTSSARSSKYNSLNASSLTSKDVNQSASSYEELHGATHERTNAPENLPQSLQLNTGNCRKALGGNSTSFVPALKQVSKSGQKSTYTKKRKLFNPGSFDYLNDVEQPD